MAVTEGEIAAALELFSELGPLGTRKMMGGLSIYFEGTIFAILHPEGEVMLKCVGPMIDRIEEMGGTQWVHTRATGVQSAMPYWRLPDEALDDPELACALARDALTLLESP